MAIQWSLFAIPILVLLVVVGLFYSIVSSESNSVNIQGVRFDDTLIPPWTTNCTSYTLTSGHTYSAYSTITLTGKLANSGTHVCQVAGVGIATLGFSFVSSNAPFTVGPGSSATLTLQLDPPTQYSGNITICVYSAAWGNGVNTASCPP